MYGRGLNLCSKCPLSSRSPRSPSAPTPFTRLKPPQGARGWLGVTLTADSESDVAARDVLDRIEIPREVTEKLASSAWLGSALIVSDEAPYKETAAGTDFLVVLSNDSADHGIG